MLREDVYIEGRGQTLSDKSITRCSLNHLKWFSTWISLPPSCPETLNSFIRVITNCVFTNRNETLQLDICHKYIFTAKKKVLRASNFSYSPWGWDPVHRPRTHFPSFRDAVLASHKSTADNTNQKSMKRPHLIL